MNEVQVQHEKKILQLISEARLAVDRFRREKTHTVGTFTQLNSSLGTLTLEYARTFGKVSTVDNSVIDDKIKDQPGYKEIIQIERSMADAITRAKSSGNTADQNSGLRISPEDVSDVTKQLLMITPHLDNIARAIPNAYVDFKTSLLHPDNHLGVRNVITSIKRT